MSDLIERLRGLSRDMAHIRLQEDNAGSMDVLMAANQIEAQQEEIARLRDGIHRAAEGLDGGADVNIITQLLDSLLEQG